MNHFKPVLTPLCLFDAVVVVAPLASASFFQKPLLPRCRLCLGSQVLALQQGAGQGCEASWD